MVTIKKLHTYSDGIYSQYRIEKEGKYCDVSLYHSQNPDRILSSFGGSIWPSDIPEVFDHYGPDAGIVTYRSGPKFRSDVVLPVEPGNEIVWAV